MAKEKEQGIYLSIEIRQYLIPRPKGDLFPLLLLEEALGPESDLRRVITMVLTMWKVPSEATTKAESLR